MIYLNLFLAYLQIGLFSIGGGHASIPVAQGVVVDTWGWLNMDEFTDMITISEMTPGPFGINSATFVGTKVGGLLGGIIATVSFLIPSVIICLSLYALISKFRKARGVDGFMQGIRPAVSGLISSAVLSIAMLAILGGSTLNALTVGFNFDYVALILATLSFIATRTLKINPVIIILISGAVGGLTYYLISLV